MSVQRFKFPKLRCFLVSILISLLAVPSAHSAVGDSCERVSAVTNDSQSNASTPSTAGWTGYKCKNCGTLTSARPNAKDGSVTCTNCSMPNTGTDFFTEEEWVALGHDVIMDDGSTKKHAESGPSVLCPGCGRANFNNIATCPGCGMSTAAAREAAAKPVTRRSAEEVQADADIEHPPSNFRRKLIWSASILGTVTLALGTYHATRTYEVTGQVESGDFSHTIYVDHFTLDTSGKDWAKNVVHRIPVMPINGVGEEPGAFNFRNIHPAVHHQEKVQVGTHIVSREYDEPYQAKETVKIDNKNGSFTHKEVTVTRYRKVYRDVTEPTFKTVDVLQMRIDYDTYRWQQIGMQELRGKLPYNENATLPWPKVELGPHDRKREAAKYKILITYKSGSDIQNYEVTPATETDFKSWKPGDETIIIKNNLGFVVEVKPVKR